MSGHPGPIRIFHNPRCSKSRQTLQLLRERALDPEIILYLDQSPRAPELQQILRQLGLHARQLMRTKEPEYRQQGLDDPALSEEALIEAMVRTPKLIERPIVVVGDKAALGRPPERVLELLP